jgi:hypothetical protein
MTDLVKAEVFQGMPVRIVQHDEKLMIPLLDIADGIQYDRKALRNLIDRNIDTMSEYTCEVMMTLQGQGREIRLISRDGVIALFLLLDTKRIKDDTKRNRIIEFRKWAIETLGKVMDGKTPVPLTHVEKPYTSFAPLIRDELEISKIMAEYGVPEHLTLAIALARIEDRTGLSMKGYHIALPPAETVKAYFTPTELGSQVGLSGKEVNQILAGNGLQYRIGSQWEVTEKGKPYAVRVYAATTNWSGFQLKWVSDVLTFIRPYSKGMQPCLMTD